MMLCRLLYLLVVLSIACVFVSAQQSTADIPCIGFGASCKTLNTILKSTNTTSTTSSTGASGSAGRQGAVEDNSCTADGGVTTGAKCQESSKEPRPTAEDQLVVSQPPRRDAPPLTPVEDEEKMKLQSLKEKTANLEQPEADRDNTGRINEKVVDAEEQHLKPPREESGNDRASVTNHETDNTQNTQSQGGATQNNPLQAAVSHADSSSGGPSTPRDSLPSPHTKATKNSDTVPKESTNVKGPTQDGSAPRKETLQSEGLQNIAGAEIQEVSKNEHRTNHSTESSTSNSETQETSTTQVHEQTPVTQDSQSNNDTSDTNNPANPNSDTPNTPSNEESTSTSTTTTTTTTTLPPTVPVNSNNKKPNIKGDADSSSSISSVWVRVPLLIVITLACILV